MDDTGHQFILFSRTTQVAEVLGMLFGTKDPDLWTEVFGLHFVGGGERGWIQDRMR